MDGSQDRRKSSRAELRSWVEITSDGVRRRAECFDLSVGGLGVELRSDGFPRDAAVISEFPLPGIGLPLELSGVVVWHDPATGRLGLRFVDLDPGLGELVESFVRGDLRG